MKYLLDTNVISELTHPKPDEKVVEWLSSKANSELYIPSPVFGELEKGCSKMEEGRRKIALAGFIEKLYISYRANIVDFDCRVSRFWGRMVGTLSSVGKTLPVIDSMIAAMALVHGMTVVTRNTRDFEITGVPLCNPFKIKEVA